MEDDINFNWDIYLLDYFTAFYNALLAAVTGSANQWNTHKSVKKNFLCIWTLCWSPYLVYRSQFPEIVIKVVHIWSGLSSLILNWQNSQCTGTLPYATWYLEVKYCWMYKWVKNEKCYSIIFATSPYKEDKWLSEWETEISHTWLKEDKEGRMSPRIFGGLLILSFAMWSWVGEAVQEGGPFSTVLVRSRVWAERGLGNEIHGARAKARLQMDDIWSLRIQGQLMSWGEPGLG